LKTILSAIPVLFVLVQPALAGSGLPLPEARDFISRYSFKECGLKASLKSERTKYAGVVHSMKVSTARNEVDLLDGSCRRANSDVIVCTGNLKTAIDAPVEHASCIEDGFVAVQGRMRLAGGGDDLASPDWMRIEFRRTSWTANYPETCDQARSREEAAGTLKIEDRETCFND
jgi:hypothetical protein